MHSYSDTTFVIPAGIALAVLILEAVYYGAKIVAAVARWIKHRRDNRRARRFARLRGRVEFRRQFRGGGRIRVRRGLRLAG